jgi:uncharacterized protein YkwD
MEYTLPNSVSKLHQVLHRHVLPLVVISSLVSFTTNPAAALAVTSESPILVREDSNQDVSLSISTFLSETNKVRAEQGISPLLLNTTLTKAAEAKLTDMQQKAYWDHFRPGDNKAPWDFIRESGYTYTVAGENLAKGFKTAKGITKAWVESPTHRANLLSAKYREVGFATGYVDAPEGRVLLTVQMFGAR